MLVMVKVGWSLMHAPARPLLEQPGRWEHGSWGLALTSCAGQQGWKGGGSGARGPIPAGA